MQRFIAEENIRRYASQLSTEFQPQRQDLLRALLRDEIQRLPDPGTRCEVIQELTSELTARIQLLERKVAQLKADGTDARRDENVLRNMEEIHRLFLEGCLAGHAGSKPPEAIPGRNGECRFF